jgi:hypothetical protein
MNVMFLQKTVRVVLFFALVVNAATPALAWTGPTAAPPSANVSAPVNISATAQTKNGYVGVNSASTPGNPLFVGGAASNWTGEFNWPNTSAPSGSYGILVGSSASGYSQFDNASGYYALLGDSSYSLYGNGNIYVSGSIQSGGYLYGPNSFGGMFTVQNNSGGCQFADVFTGGCSCPGFAPNAANYLDSLWPNTNYVMVGYLCY